ncbi:MAG TPA: CDP-alcohol phosphatidyltransferase family protein [Sphingomicrobium sp.]|nr:CDP-alcohol phosphatidyltransferase family protein [Sphingomicrobium sp.]
MPDLAASSPRPQFVTIGHNSERIFGMTAGERAVALAANAGLDPSDVAQPGRSTVLADLGWAWDPAWLKVIAARPGSVLVKDGRPVLAHIVAGAPIDPAIVAIQSGLVPTGLDSIDADDSEHSYTELRKRERPFALRLEPGKGPTAERAAYDGSYKGVTDALTLYLWRRPAFHLTRWAALAGIKPNQVTLVGAALCVATFFLWIGGHFWAGMATGFGFMVLDTVDGKLARCTGQSSRWGNIFDHGVDLIHPPFWWWAWAEGLRATGQGFERVYELMVVGTIIVCYIVQRLIEGVFIKRFGMDMHTWRRADSLFRLVTARRNPNMAILLLALALGAPALGLELVALWTFVSLLFHAVRLAQASEWRRRGRPVSSWLA